LSSERTSLLQGTLDLLILKSLTRGTFSVKPGSLFPALHRMEEQGWISKLSPRRNEVLVCRSLVKPEDSLEISSSRTELTQI
jgi:hypothetical protein